MSNIVTIPGGLLDARGPIEKILAERVRQVGLWGTQRQDFATWLAILTEEVGEAATEVNHFTFTRHEGQKAIAMTALEAELAQVAAVCVSIMEQIAELRRTGAPCPIGPQIDEKTAACPTVADWLKQAGWDAAAPGTFRREYQNIPMPGREDAVDQVINVHMRANPGKPCVECGEVLEIGMQGCDRCWVAQPMTRPLDAEPYPPTILETGASGGIKIERLQPSPEALNFVDVMVQAQQHLTDAIVQAAEDVEPWVERPDRPEFLIIDDLDSDKTPEQRKAANEWYQGGPNRYPEQPGGTV